MYAHADEHVDQWLWSTWRKSNAVQTFMLRSILDLVLRNASLMYKYVNTTKLY